MKCRYMHLKLAIMINKQLDQIKLQDLENLCAGRPVIAGTRTTVRAIVEVYKQSLSVEDILLAMPYLTPAQVHDALSYYYDHQQEIEDDILQHLEENCIRKYPPNRF